MTSATVLDAARQWRADLIVLDKSARSASGEPYIEIRTGHIPEFCEEPVPIVASRPHH